MKKILFVAAAACCLFSVPSCKDVDASDQASIQTMTDSLLAIPSVGSVKLGVEGRSYITVVLGAPKLYNASEADQKKEAEEVGKMALRIFGKDNFLEKGSLILTKDEKNREISPKDGITVPIDIEGLKKANKQ